jgi:hypothetical protein
MPKITPSSWEELVMAMDASDLAGPVWQRMPAPALRRGYSPDARPMKGEHGGECQRIACDNSNARWFNETNGRYYCASCARTFNEVSRLHGQEPLCELHL